MAPDLHGRIAGSLYGLLVGDALGCAVEGWPPDKIRATYGRVQTMEEARERWRPAGLHPDDGQQALALCDALLHDPRRPAARFAQLLVDLYQAAPKRRNSFGLHRGTGRDCRQAIKCLLAGCEPHAAGQPADGNGVAMMSAPLGLYWRDDDAALCAAVVDVARVKQTDIRGIAAAGAIAWLTARALGLEQFGEIRHAALLGFVRRVEDEAAAATGGGQHLHTFSDAVADMLSHLGEPRSAVLEGIVAFAQRTVERDVYPGSGYVLASPVTAIYMTLTSGSYRQVIVDTINLGGDTDTMGAMVGAMTGALYGFAAIPAEWHAQLHAGGRLGDRIEGLLRHASGWLPGESLVALEGVWTALLDRR